MHASSTLRHALAVTHPSLPNYLALTAGTTFGIEDDSGPSAHRLGGASIFSQVQLHHLTWASFEESMPSRCARASSGLYAVKHNPAAYFVALRAARSLRRRGCAHPSDPLRRPSPAGGHRTRRPGRSRPVGCRWCAGRGSSST